MTSRIDAGVVTFDCDGPRCHKNFQSFVEKDFRAVWAEARDSGWVNAINADDTWSHYCPACRHIVGD